jgi:Holliday junction resolvase RusA-like endonuclease
MKIVEFVYNDPIPSYIPSKKLTYTIKGPPSSYTKHADGHRSWDVQKLNRLNAESQLQDQRGTSPLLRGLLHLDIDFYFPFQGSRIKKQGREGRPCGVRPPLLNLVNFIEIIGHEILWARDSIITSINSKKIYDNNPRTEIFIMELK